MGSTRKLTAAQSTALEVIRQRGRLSGGTGAQYGVRLATVRRLAELGLVTLTIESHKLWFGSHCARARTTVEWVATPIAN